MMISLYRGYELRACCDADLVAIYHRGFLVDHAATVPDATALIDDWMTAK